MALLSDRQIAEALKSLPAWELLGSEIVRSVRFPDFMAGIAAINRIAEAAEAADHHPDIDIRYRNIKFVLSTHDQGGLTEKDISLAHQIDEFVS